MHGVINDGLDPFDRTDCHQGKHDVVEVHSPALDSPSDKAQRKSSLRVVVCRFLHDQTFYIVRQAHFGANF